MGGFNIGPVYWNASSLSAKVSDLGVFSLHYSHYSCNVFFCKLINNTLPFITGERAPNNRLSLQWFLMFRVCHYLFSSSYKISSWLRRRNLKTEVSRVFSVRSMLEKFENTTITGHLDLCLWKTRSGKSHVIIVTPTFSKSFVSSSRKRSRH